jgi:hypothetical protein
MSGCPRSTRRLTSTARTTAPSTTTTTTAATAPRSSRSIASPGPADVLAATDAVTSPQPNSRALHPGACVLARRRRRVRCVCRPPYAARCRARTARRTGTVGRVTSLPRPRTRSQCVAGARRGTSKRRRGRLRKAGLALFPHVGGSRKFGVPLGRMLGMQRPGRRPRAPGPRPRSSRCHAPGRHPDRRRGGAVCALPTLPIRFNPAMPQRPRRQGGAALDRRGGLLDVEGDAEEQERPQHDCQQR